MKKYLVPIFIVATFIITALLYRNSFSAYFFQDDWFTLRISRADNLNDVVSFFIPRTDVIYYRPLGMQVPFFLLRTLFGLNSFPYHAVIYIFHLINSLLVFLLVYEITKKTQSSLVALFLYSTAAFNYIPFYWLSTVAFVLGPTFSFTSLYLFIKFIYKPKKSWFAGSVLFFIAGLFTNEIVFVLPLVMFFYLIYTKKLKLVSYLLPFFISAGMLFLIRFMFFTPVTSDDYKIAIGRSVVSNLEAYFLWSLNWPEELKAQLVNFYTINSQFIKNFTIDTIVFVSSLAILLVSFIMPVIFSLFAKHNINVKLIILGMLWYVAGLLPVIIFPSHAFSYYLPLSFVGMVLFIIPSWLASLKYIKKILSYGVICIVLFVWILCINQTIEFNAKVHFAPRRARISRELVDKILSEQNGKTVFYVAPQSENKLALNDQDGLKVILNNNNIVTFYGYPE